MNKLLTATALLATLLSSSAFARNAEDYMDKDLFFCNKEEIKEEVTAMFEQGPPAKRGERVIYVKGDPVEISRKPSLLRLPRDYCHQP
jgi:hypothetical protein